MTTRRFAPLFVTQFLAAVQRQPPEERARIVVTYRIASSCNVAASSLVMLSGGLFIAPFFLFSGASGTLARRTDKAVIARWVRLREIAIHGARRMGLWQQSMPRCSRAVLLSCGPRASPTRRRRGRTAR